MAELMKRRFFSLAVSLERVEKFILDEANGRVRIVYCRRTRPCGTVAVLMTIIGVLKVDGYLIAGGGRVFSGTR